MPGPGYSAGVPAFPLTSSGAVILTWVNFYYVAGAAAPLWLMYGGAAGFPGVGGAQEAPTVDWSRFRVPFPMTLQGMMTYGRVEAGTPVDVTFDLRRGNDTVSIQTMTKLAGNFFASVALNAPIATGDILTVRTTHAVMGGLTAANNLFTVWGFRTGV